LNIQVLASGSSGNAYVVESGRSRILLECGIPAKEILMRSGFKSFDAVLVSHDHKDHSKAVGEALKWGVPVGMPQEMSKGLKHHSAYGLLDGDRLQHVDPDGSSIDVKPFKLQHDIPCLGYCITFANERNCGPLDPFHQSERLIYITDTMYCKYTFPQATHWMIECNMSRDILDENVDAGIVHAKLRNRIVQNHMDLDTVKNMLLANDLSHTQEIWLLHLSNDNSDAERFRREVQEVTGKAVYIA
jgi:phosphoribosyl 1,2-cyclic phosphodiesterase